MVRVALAVPPVTVWKFPLPSSKLAVILPVTLFLVPPLFGVTFTEKEQEVDAGRFIESRIRPLPGLAATEAPKLVTHVPVKPFGEATTRPLGSGSVNAVLTSVVLLLGLVTVKLSVVVCPRATSLGLKALVRVGATTAGAAVTVKLAVLLVAPGPLSLAEIGPVVLFRVPVTVGVTDTEMKQAPLAIDSASPFTGREVLWPRVEIKPTAWAMAPPVRVTEVEPATAVSVPPQSLLALGVAATCKPAGSASVKEIPVKVTSLFGAVELLFGLLIVKLSKTGTF